MLLLHLSKHCDVLHLGQGVLKNQKDHHRPIDMFANFMSFSWNIQWPPSPGSGTPRAAALCERAGDQAWGKVFFLVLGM